MQTKKTAFSYAQKTSKKKKVHKQTKKVHKQTKKVHKQTKKTAFLYA